MDANIAQHFRKEEGPFIDQIQSWAGDCLQQYAPILTPFLDPRQQFIVQSVIGPYEDLKLTFQGGYLSAERQRCLIGPSYFEADQDDFDLSLLEIIYPHKFAQLSHGKILGSLMSLGIDRGLLGDILTDGSRWQVFCSRPMEDYLKLQFNKVGSVPIRVETRNYSQILVPTDHWQDGFAIVSSLRLDTLISSVFNISRQRAKDLVESGKVKVNWAIQERPDFSLDFLDIVSIRGFGRIQVRSIEGKTKKDKIRLQLGILDKNQS